MIFIVLLLGLAAVGFIIFGFFKVLNGPVYTSQTLIKRNITVEQLGIIEGSLTSLEEIVIIADQIEMPTNELLQSVTSNFKKGVRYTFLISKANYEKEKTRYYKFFEVIADIISKDYNMSSYLDIYALNFNWDDYPYVFYRYKDPSGALKAFAYMGTQIREGIADKYELIPPTLALKIINMAFNGVEIANKLKIEKEELFDIKPMLLAKTA